MGDIQEEISFLEREFQSELSKAQQKRAALSDAIPNRSKLTEEHLARARDFYKKKEWARAFHEWDQVCALLEEGDEFRKKVAVLRESHENLNKVNQELAEIKGILNQRSAPPAADRKFVQDAHEEVSGQVKNVYSYLGQQLRTERTPKKLSFWWPVILATVLVSGGYFVLTGYYTKTQKEIKEKARQSTDVARSELSSLRADRDEAVKKMTALQGEYEQKIEQLKQQNEGWRNAGREKVEELEVQLKELETKNKDLSQKIERVMQDNLSKDRLIDDLSRRQP